jgi:RluA family pseudouridine synthase
VAKLPYIEFANGMRIPILHEDRNIIAIDKPPGWMLAPVSWQSTGRNLFAALTSSINGGDFWAQSRNLKYIRFAHRLDADTSGVLLLVKAPGALPAYTELFEERHVEKVYLAVVKGVPEVAEWKCRLRVAPVPEQPGRMEINNALGKDCETLFRVIDKKADRALVMCWPLTGRTHQIRLHLTAVGHPIWADELYGPVPTTTEEKTDLSLGLRAIRVSYKDPFKAERVTIEADAEAFVKAYGFDPANAALKNVIAPEKALEHPKARFEELRKTEKEKRKHERDLRRAERPEREPREFRPREDWPQDNETAGFAAEAGAEGGEGSFEERPPRREFHRGPREERGFGGKRPFGGPRPFERREGGHGRKFGGGHEGGGEPRGEFRDRPPRREGFGKPFRKPFEKKPFRGTREFADGAGGAAGERPRSFAPRGDRGERGERGGGFRGRPGGKPGYGRPFEQRGERRPYGGGFRPTHEEDDNRGNREGANEGRHGLFPSSAKPGLKAGFQKFGASGSRRPFRTGGGGHGFRAGGGDRPFRPRHEGGPREGGHPSSFGGGGGGGFGKKPFRKFGGGKPGWGKKPGGRPFKKF